MKVTVLLLLVGFCSSVLAGGLDPTTEKEIAYLISYLGSSGCQFNRNGAWYNTSRAVSHLNRKYEYLRKRNLLPDTDAFIEHAASVSSASGKPYLVKCGNKPEVQSGAWFRQALEDFRAGSGHAKERR